MKSGFVFLQENVFPTLIALSHEEQSKGLMYQEWPPPVMSFVYFKPQINRFWMKNTPSPLDIIFCYNNKISEICRGEPFSTKVIGGEKESDLVIELPYGTVKSSGIKIGDNVGLIKPTLFELKKIAGIY